jgi:GTPase
VEGRDIGTVVLPDADVKVFLTATVEERARRRGEQTGRGDLDVLAAEIRERDEADSSRDVAPMLRADDAVEIDTTGRTVDDVVATIVRRAHEVVNPDPVAARRALPRIAIVGRPNVGKSTLVNRIVGRRVAIVEERPGVTRDRVEHRAEWVGRDLVVVDTGGWEQGAKGMGQRIVEQAQAAIDGADVVLFVVDATVGVLADDEAFARRLRRGSTPVLLVANKVDGERQQPLVHDLHSLGLGDAFAVSARHGRGVGDLLDAAVALLPAGGVEPTSTPCRPSRSSVDRTSASPRCSTDWWGSSGRSSTPSPHDPRRRRHDGGARWRPWRFVDTAGMRRRYRHGEDTELYSVDRTRDAIEQAHLVLFVVDAANRSANRTRDWQPCCATRAVAWCWCATSGTWSTRSVGGPRPGTRSPAVLRGVGTTHPCVGADRTRSEACDRPPRSRLGQLSATGPHRELNRVVEDAVAMHAPPRRGNRSLRIRYSTQAEVAPPRFIMFANGPIPPGYRRYLERVLRERYDFTGVPLAIDDRPPSRRDGPARRR